MKNKKNKRLNLVIDPASFQDLENIKSKHGDPSYTQAIKRAIALQRFVDQKKEEGAELYVGESTDKLTKIILTS